MSSSPLHWQATYDTGIEEIDLQHRYFMALINRLTVELAASDDPKYRQSLLNELAKYAAFHFASEENLMAKFGYPDRERHRMLHIELIDKLSSRMNAMTYERLCATSFPPNSRPNAGVPCGSSCRSPQLLPPESALTFGGSFRPSRVVRWPSPCRWPPPCRQNKRQRR